MKLVEELYIKNTEGFDIYTLGGTNKHPTLACPKEHIKEGLSSMLSHLVGVLYHGTPSNLAKGLGAVTPFLRGEKEPSFTKVVEILEELGLDLEITVKPTQNEAKRKVA